MTTTGPSWRHVFTAAERAVTTRLEALVRTSEFSKGAALAVRAQAAVRAQVAGLSSRAWHAVNLPAGTDIVRLRSQIGALDRELRRLSMRLEQQQGQGVDQGEGQGNTGRGDEA
jgi:hypothetical protein